MRVVIYDEETLEPITVVNLRGVTERDIDRLRQRIRVPVFPEVSAETVSPAMDFHPLKVVDLTFERIARRDPRSGMTQYAWMCFTRQEELALALVPDWLPGQRGAVNVLIAQNEKLSAFILSAITRHL